MFNRTKNKSTPQTPERFDTIIGRTIQINGHLMLQDSVRIDGKVVGNIEAAQDAKITIAIGKTGEVHGNIMAHRVMVAGKVEGNILANERVELLSESTVQGDISYGSIAIENGAHVFGLMMQNANTPPVADSSVEAQAVIVKPQETGQ